MNFTKSAQERKIRRAARTRAKIFGSALRPRLSVFRSNKFIFAQLIDDEAGKTLLSGSTRGLSGKEKMKKAEEAFALGELVAKKAAENGIKEAVFDRRSYQYHGRVSAVADGARKGGLKI
ncbi:MAG: 50S ribosomal protein L18 [Patescibacteria group bacterium]